MSIKKFDQKIQAAANNAEQQEAIVHQAATEAYDARPSYSKSTLDNFITEWNFYKQIALEVLAERQK